MTPPTFKKIDLEKDSIAPKPTVDCDIYTEIDGLARKITDKDDNIICKCSGTLAEINRCLADASAVDDVNNIHASIGAYVARTCAQQGLVQISRKIAKT